jgi:alcohol dehydrogenase class IV
MESSFFNPVSVSFLEPGAWRDRLLHITGNEKSVLFIYSGSAVSSCDPEGVLQHKLSNISNVKLLTGIESNPSVKQLVKIRKELGTLPETVVALGGGSVIDVAKILIALDRAPHDLDEQTILEMVSNKSYLKLDKAPVRFIALPSTAGTGSELTKWATIWDMVNKKKFSVERDDLYPTESWVDLELTLGLDARLTVSTGLDAMSHAVEAYWSSKSNPIVRRLAAQAISEVIKNLEAAVDNPKDIDARRGMCLGSVFAGLAFSQTRTTACHALSYPLTARFGLPHGIAVSMSMVEVLALNWNAVEEKSLFLGAFGCDSYESLREKLINMIERFVNPEVAKIGPIDNVSAIISEDIESMGARLGNNPVGLTKDQIIGLYQKILGR